MKKRDSDRHCVNCQARMRLATEDARRPAKPRVGDVAVCVRCASVMKFNEKLDLREVTKQEMDELAADQEWFNYYLGLLAQIEGK